MSYEDIQIYKALGKNLYLDSWRTEKNPAK